MANKIVQLTDADNNNIYPIGYAQGGVKMDLLWTNSTPTASFAPQTLSLDLSNYEWIIISCKQSANRFGYLINHTIKVDGNTNVLMGIFDQTDTAITISDFYKRNCTVSTTGIIFTNNVNSTSTTLNDYNVPYQIYGIKTSYIVPTTVNGLQYVEVQ